MVGLVCLNPIFRSSTLRHTHTHHTHTHHPHTRLSHTHHTHPPPHTHHTHTHITHTHITHTHLHTTLWHPTHTSTPTPTPTPKPTPTQPHTHPPSCHYTAPHHIPRMLTCHRHTHCAKISQKSARCYVLHVKCSLLRFFPHTHVYASQPQNTVPKCATHGMERWGAGVEYHFQEI